MSTRLLRDLGGLKGLHQATFDELALQPGMAVAKTRANQGWPWSSDDDSRLIRRATARYLRPGGCL